MSFWAKIQGVQIQDLGVFQNVCEKHQISYTVNQDQAFKMQGYAVHAVLQDRNGGGQAFVVQDGGGFRLFIDNDVNYSSISRRLGTGGGRLTRDYTSEFIQRGVRRKGGSVTEVEQPDGSLILRVRVAA
jgi:hypothetical protein